MQAATWLKTSASSMQAGEQEQVRGNLMLLLLRQAGRNSVPGRQPAQQLPIAAGQENYSTGGADLHGRRTAS